MGGQRRVLRGLGVGVIGVLMHLMGTEAVWAAPASGPTVTQMSPAQGTVDTFVTITGTGFDANAANDVVQFTGLDKKSAPTGTIVSASVTQLRGMRSSVED